MSAASQTHREIEFISPLGKDVLLVRHFNAVEELGRIYQFDLTLQSSKEDIDFESLLGQNATIRLDTDSQRFFNGYVTEFSQDENKGGYATYTVTLAPWLWFLSLTNDCRIFQDKKATDIIQAVFIDTGYSDFELRLSNTYRLREYTVQYRESDFNFVSRLMEEEGIYYFFEHSKKGHKLILCDGYPAHKPIKGESVIAYYPPDTTTVREKSIINYWRHTRRVLPGSIALNDYDFKKSRADIKTLHIDPKPHEKADAEIYDYPGVYVKGDEGTHYARMRQEELHGAYAIKEGSGTVRDFTAGGLYTMKEHTREDQNIEYLITQVVHNVEQDTYGLGHDGASPFQYQNSFRVVESATPFRAESVTMTPKVEGPQNAKIVGPAGEEIYCDEYGRVKVQFPWDRYGKSNENSSCWIRVNQVWAGGSWGGMSIPRINQEVIVDFYEGNPDRPIITGRVYNDANPAPYGLPAKKTQMTIKSKTHKGVGFNEMRFDDDNGKEEIFIHAQKDQNNIVLNDETTDVGHDRTENIHHDETITIDHDRTETVHHDETITIDNNRTETVHNNEKIRIDHNRTESVGDNEKITIGKNRTEKVGLNETITIGKNRTEKVGDNETISIGKNRTETVGDNESITIGKNQSVNIGKAQSTKIGKSQSIKIGGSKNEKISKSSNERIGIAKSLAIGAAYQVTVGASKNETIGLTSTEQVGMLKHIIVGKRFELQVGESSLILNADGTIILSGKEIKIEGSKHCQVNSKLVDIN